MHSLHCRTELVGNGIDWKRIVAHYMSNQEAWEGALGPHVGGGASHRPMGIILSPSFKLGFTNELENCASNNGTWSQHGTELQGR